MLGPVLRIRPEPATGKKPRSAVAEGIVIPDSLRPNQADPRPLAISSGCHGQLSGERGTDRRADDDRQSRCNASITATRSATTPTTASGLLDRRVHGEERVRRRHQARSHPQRPVTPVAATPTSRASSVWPRWPRSNGKTSTTGTTTAGSPSGAAATTRWSRSSTRHVPDDQANQHAGLTTRLHPIGACHRPATITT